MNRNLKYYSVSWIITIGFSFSAIQLMDNMTECFLFKIILWFVHILCPIHKSILQGYKQKINGPWDIARVQVAA